VIRCRYTVVGQTYSVVKRNMITIQGHTRTLDYNHKKLEHEFSNNYVIHEIIDSRLYYIFSDDETISFSSSYKGSLVIVFRIKPHRNRNMFLRILHHHVQGYTMASKIVPVSRCILYMIPC